MNPATKLQPAHAAHNCLRHAITTGAGCSQYFRSRVPVAACPYFSKLGHDTPIRTGVPLGGWFRRRFSVRTSVAISAFTPPIRRLYAIVPLTSTASGTGAAKVTHRHLLVPFRGSVKTYWEEAWCRDQSPWGSWLCLSHPISPCCAAAHMGVPRGSSTHAWLRRSPHAAMPFRRHFPGSLKALQGSGLRVKRL